jgi:septal ring factor EnvC (AmiA/AmiB activator)
MKDIKIQMKIENLEKELRDQEEEERNVIQNMEELNEKRQELSAHITFIQNKLYFLRKGKDY